MQASAYGAAAVPAAVLGEWHAANPHAFSVLTAPHGDIVGHLHLLPVRPAPLHAFVEGRIHDFEIRGDGVHRPGEREQVRDLYLESIMVRMEPREARRAALACLLGTVGGMVQEIAEPHVVENVYAIAATEPGRRLLARLGFVLVSPGARRVDGLDLVRVGCADLLHRAAAFASSG